MTDKDIIDPERPGRHSGIRRLKYQPSREKLGDGKARKDVPPPPKDWHAVKDQLRRTLKHTPEVVINVDGSRRKGDNDHTANRGVLRYMMYISRSGKLPTVDEKGDKLTGRDTVKDTHASWDLDMQRLRSARDDPLHPTFNIIFSMPAKTDPDMLLESVQAFARNHFRGHQYVMALHTPETDPSKKPPAHPHVHVILRAEDENGQRIHIRKTNLRAWRESFAAELRSRGIEANATSRAERGVSLLGKHAAEWHIIKRENEERAIGKEPKTMTKARRARFTQYAQELAEGCTELKPWEIAMQARRRDVLRQLQANAVRLREEGNNELADQVDAFMHNMPPVDSERCQVQRALVQQVEKRLQDRGRKDITADRES